MEFTYIEKIPEENLYWTVSTSFKEEKWKEIVAKCAETQQVISSEFLQEWVGKSIEGGKTIAISFRESENSEYIPGMQYLLSPGSWREQLTCYLGEEKAREIILDFIVKLSKRIWDETKKEKENMYKNIPTGITITDEYIENLGVMVKVDFRSPQKVVAVANEGMSFVEFLEKAGSKIKFTFRIKSEVRVEGKDRSVEVEYDFRNHPYENIKNSLPDSLRFQGIFLDSKNFTTIWSGIDRTLSKEITKLISVVSKMKEVDKKAPDFETHISLTYGDFRGDLIFFFDEEKLKSTINLTELFRQKGCKKLVVKGTFEDQQDYRIRRMEYSFTDFPPDFWSGLEGILYQLVSKNNSMTDFISEVMTPLYTALQENIYKHVDKRGTSLEDLYSRHFEILGALKEHRSKVYELEECKKIFPMESDVVTKAQAVEKLARENLQKLEKEFEEIYNYLKVAENV